MSYRRTMNTEERLNTLISGLFIAACLLAISIETSIAQSTSEEVNEKQTTYETSEDLGEYVVTGTRTQRRLAEVPVRTELIRRDLIDSSQARTLADAVEFTTGVRVESNCINCNFSAIRLNGLEGTFTQILFDSQQTVSSLAAVYGIEQIPSALVQQVEIVKGGASSLYGPGAIGGVVNIIPREPTETGVEANYRYEWMDGLGSSGNNHSFNSVVGFTSDDKLVNGFIYGQREELNALDLSGDEFSEISQRNLTSFGARVNRFFEEADAKLTLDYNRFDEDRRGGDNIDLPPFQAQIAEDLQTVRDAALVSWAQTVSPDFDYRITGSYALTDRDSYYGADFDPNAFGTSKNPLYNLDTQINHHFDAAGMHTFSWGVQHNRSEIEDQQPAYERFINDTFYYTGLYLQDDWTITPNLNLVTGARLDKHSEVSGAIVSPRVALLSTVADNVRLRTSVSTGFRAPQVFDEDLHISIVGGEGTIIRNSPDLEEEKSISYQFGAEYTPTIGNGVGLLETNLFWTEITDSFFNDVTDDPSTTNQLEFTRINRGGASVYGAEFNLGYQIAEQISVELGYVEQRARYDSQDNDFFTRDYFRTPQRYGAATLTWKNPEFADLFVGVKYTGPMQVPHFEGFIPENRLEESESFVTLDMSLQREFRIGQDSFIWTIGGRNLTNELQEDYDNGPLRDADYVYGPRFPRSIYTTLGYKF